jgi:NTP pyrophosphatase (non-canonical NTP hydrolase)
MSLEFSDYQKQAASTAIYPESEAVFYPCMGLAGEAGEVAGKASKIMRDKNRVICDDDRVALLKEVGDVLWFCAQVCTDLRANMSDVAQMNLNKLNSRLQRGVLGGSGDDR